MIHPINRDIKFLSQKSSPASPNDAQLLQDLQDTLLAHRENCVGMAANMIGVNKRVIIAMVGFLPVIMVNPKIVLKNDQYETSEGCLSLPGERSTTRYKNITVQYLDRNFKPVTQEFSDFTAQIIQHEIDHLDGILI